MLRYFFWNVHDSIMNNQLKRKSNTLLRDIILKYKPNIIGLAEYKDDMTELIEMLNGAGGNYTHVPQLGCTRINIITEFGLDEINRRDEGPYYSMYEMPYINKGKQLVVFVHMRSKLYKSDIEQIPHAANIKNKINEIVGCNPDSNVVVLGDFNMNPFAPAMVMGSVMAAIPYRSIVSNIKTRRIDRTNNIMLYNPTWKFMGEGSIPHGTYYYSSGDLVYYWNVLDQVLVSPAVVPYFDLESLEIIHEGKLEKSTGKPKFSDHFPIMFKIQ